LKADVWNDAGAWLVLLPLLLAPLAFRRGWAAALCLLVLAAVQAPPASAAADGWWSRADQEGVRAFERGEPGVAAELFDDPAWRGVSQYKSGDFEGAIETLQGREDTLSQYNLGNALAQASHLEEAIDAYEQILEQDPSHEDARFNRDLVQELLEQQQQEQERQQQEQQEQQQPQQGQDPQQQDEPQQSQQQSSEGQSQEPQGQPQSQESQPSQQPEDPTQQQAENSTQQPGQQQKQPQKSPSEYDQDSEPAGSASSREPGPREASEEARAGTQSESGEGEEQQGGAPPAPGAARELSERDQEVEQWLNRVPDDPGGLLREKLRRRYAERRYGAQGGWR
jgi:Ca-activated chloride channel family protein